MTMRTKQLIQCSCGHIGTIHRSENDQPYSACWERYSLDGLNGNGSYYVEGYAKWDQVFKALNPTCPSCNKRLSPDDFKK